MKETFMLEEVLTDKITHHLKWKYTVQNKTNGELQLTFLTVGVCAITTLNDQLVIGGGLATDFSKVTKKIFLLKNNRLMLYRKKMTKPRYKTSAFDYQGTLILIGSLTKGEKLIFSTELFDSSIGQWYTTNELPLPQFGLQSVIADNLLYLLGGIEDNKASQTVFTASLFTVIACVSRIHTVLYPVLLLQFCGLIKMYCS